MGSRNVLAVLVVIFVAVLLYNGLYFTGVVGNYYGAEPQLGPLPRDERFEIPGFDRDNEAQRPQASGVRQPDGQPGQTRPEGRAAAAADALTIGASWGRNPFLTPQEIWAVENFRPVYQTTPSTPPADLYLSAVMLDSTGRRVAIINGEVYAVGDVVGGMQVLEMGSNGVVFLLDGRRHVIRIGDPDIKLRSSRPGSQ